MIFVRLKTVFLKQENEVKNIQINQQPLWLWIVKLICMNEQFIIINSVPIKIHFYFRNLEYQLETAIQF